MEFRKSYVEAIAFIGGKSVPITRLVVNFELNGIPTGEIGLPFGRLVQSGQASKINELLAGLKSRTKAQLVIRARAAQSTKLPDYVPNGIYRLFDGFVDNSNSRRNPHAIEYSVGLTHALIEMHDSSALSGASHIANPNYFYAPAALSDLKANSQALTPVGLAGIHITSANLADDVWGKALYPWMTAITAEDRLKVSRAGTGVNIVPEPNKKNSGAARALKRLDPTIKQTMPSKLTNFDDIDLANAMALSLNNNARCVDRFSRQTLWDVMVGDVLSPLFLAVIPFSWGGYVRPFVAGLRTEKAVVLTDLDVEEITIVKHFPRQPMAIGLLGGFGSRGGLTGQANSFNTNKAQDKEGYRDVVGYYSNDEVKDGLIRFAAAPGWIADRAFSSFQTSVGLNKDGVGAVASAFNPIAAKAIVEANNERVKSGRVKLEKTLDNLARCLYLTEVLQQRQMIVRGPLRFDLAPGTRIRMVVSPDKFTGQNFATKEPLGLIDATVVRVTIVISTNPNEYNTLLHLAHVATVKETAKDAYGTEKHPLYEQAFINASIAEKINSAREKQYPTITEDKELTEDVVTKAFSETLLSQFSVL